MTPKFKIGDKVIVTTYDPFTKVTKVTEGIVTAAEYSVRWDECFYDVAYPWTDKRGRTRNLSFIGVTEDSISLK